MKRSVHSYDAIFALILFFAFALSMLMVLLTGAGVYQRIRGSAESRFSEETCVSYLTMKLRSYDGRDDCSVNLDKVGGNDALYLTEIIADTEYVTTIYWYDGYVRELFAESGYTFEPDSGLEIIEADGLKMTRDGSLLRIICDGSGGSTADIYVNLMNWRASE